MKRPGVVWVYSIFVILGIIYSIVSDISTITNPAIKLLEPIVYYSSIIDLILVIPFLIFVYLFFTLKRSSLIWLYVTFGFSILVNLVARNWFVAVVLVIFGWAVWDYIRNKEIDGKKVFT